MVNRIATAVREHSCLKRLNLVCSPHEQIPFIITGNLKVVSSLKDFQISINMAVFMTLSSNVV
jgi:hypothetical protein